MQIILMPSTERGKLSLRFAFTFLSLFILLHVISAVGNGMHALDTDQLNIFKIIIPFFIIPAALSAIAGFFTGMTAIIKNKERALATFISSAVGLLVLLFVIGEFTVPH